MPTTTLFTHRQSGEKAVHVGGYVARAEEAIRVVLEAHDGRVLVKSVRCQPDGTFTGEVYGVKPHQRSVAVGDVVQFQESQIYSFRTSDEPPKGPAKEGMPDMIRQFEARFGELQAAQPDKHATARDSFMTADVSLPSTPKTQDQPVPAQATGASVDVASAAARTGADEVRQEASVDKTMAIVRAPEEPTPSMPAERVEPPPVYQATPAPVESAAERAPRCIECGTRLVIVPAPEGTNAEPLKISCRVCGRINTLPEGVRPKA